MFLLHGDTLDGQHDNKDAAAVSIMREELGIQQAFYLLSISTDQSASI